MYYMTNLQNITNILGLILCVTTSLLTFQGWYTSACACRFVYICMSSFAKNKNNYKFSIV